MGLFDSLKRRREIDALAKAYQAEPSPQGAIALADKQANAGQLEAAVKTCRDALGGFPKSEKLFARYLYLRKQQVADRLRELKSARASGADAATYGELIDIYLDLDEIDRALELGRECIAQFPDSDVGYRQTGRIRLWRWRTDHLARDGQRAIELLTKAADRNRSSLDALRLLAEIYVQLGQPGPALRNLQAIQRFGADDDGAIAELVVRAEALQGQDNPPVDERLAAIERGEPLSMDDPRLLTGLGARVQPPFQADRHRPPDADRVAAGLGRLAALPGFQSAVVVTPGGELAFSHLADEREDPHPLVEMTAQLFEIARTSTMRTDLGRFYQGQIEGPAGPLLLASCEGYMLSVCFSPDGPTPEAAWEVVEQLIADGWSGP